MVEASVFSRCVFWIGDTLVLGADDKPWRWMNQQEIHARFGSSSWFGGNNKRVLSEGERDVLAVCSRQR